MTAKAIEIPREMPENVVLRAENVSKYYGGNREAAAKLLAGGASKDEVLRKTGTTVALDRVSFDVRRGEILTLIGLSGSGKSTMARCLNLLNRPSAGKIFYQGRDIATFDKKELNEYRRNRISMVFQSFGLMSHRNVLDNVAFGLEIRGMERAQREEKAMELIHLVGLNGWENHRIDSLSGGMKQRVGIARALCNEPEILLMDEPFSALDPLVRNDMQFELMEIQKKLEKTIVFITHDINEAFKLGDTVAIMRDGRVEQIDTPETMSRNPANDYVRDFINSADKSRVLTVRHVMQKPGCIVRVTDALPHAVQEMRVNGVSSAYVVGQKLQMLGVVTIDSAIRSLQAGDSSLANILITEVPQTSADVLINDILPLAAEARFPLAVLDEGGSLQGIVTKASVLASMI